MINNTSERLEIVIKWEEDKWSLYITSIEGFKEWKKWTLKKYFAFREILKTIPCKAENAALQNKKT